jgi:hypothetical protein
LKWLNCDFPNIFIILPIHHPSISSPSAPHIQPIPRHETLFPYRWGLAAGAPPTSTGCEAFMVMADNKQQQQPGATNSTAGSSTAAAATTPAGMDGVHHNAPVNMAEYKKSQARVRELIEKRRLLEKRLVRITILLPPLTKAGEGGQEREKENNWLTEHFFGVCFRPKWKTVLRKRRARISRARQVGTSSQVSTTT